MRHVAKLPTWCVVGAAVDYSSVIGQPPTVLDARVTDEPWMLPGPGVRGGTWVTMIDKKRGWVAVAALRPAVRP